MSKVEAILSQLKEVAAHPKAMIQIIKQTGKGAVGIMPIYDPFPEEMVSTQQVTYGYLGRTGQTDFQSTYISARIRLFHHAADHGTAVRRRLR